MKMCIITSSKLPPEEGVGNYVWNLAIALQKRGHEVSVISKSDKAVILNVSGVKIYQDAILSGFPRYLNEQRAVVEGVLEKLNPDVIYMHVPLVMTPKTDKKIITMVHTSLVADAKYAKSMKIKVATALISRPTTKKLIERSSFITTPSEAVASEVVKYYGVDENKVSAIGSGVSDDILKNQRNEQRKPSILYVGRLDPRKGIFDLLEAAKSIQVNAQVLIVGKGAAEAELKRKVVEMGLNDKIKFLGHVTRRNLLRLYATCTVAVLPSHYEGLPITLLEMMGSGMPVVTTNIPSITCVVEHNKNGLLVKPSSQKALVYVIRRLLADHRLRQRLGRAARRTVEKEYTWDKVAIRVEKICEAI